MRTWIMDDDPDELLDQIMRTYDILNEWRKSQLIRNLTEYEKMIYKKMKANEKVPDRYILYFN